MSFSVASVKSNAVNSTVHRSTAANTSRDDKKENEVLRVYKQPTIGLQETQQTVPPFIEVDRLTVSDSPTDGVEQPAPVASLRRPSTPDFPDDENDSDDETVSVPNVPEGRVTRSRTNAAQPIKQNRGVRGGTQSNLTELGEKELFHWRCDVLIACLLQQTCYALGIRKIWILC